MTDVTNEARHRAAVAQIEQAYAAIPAGSKIRLAKTTSNLFRFRADVADSQLDVSQFSRVVCVDPERRTAVVGGMTTYEDLVAATLRHGLMPLVVPQLKTITLGGAVSGLGVESTSLRSGMPHESVLAMEILTGDGRVVTATPTGEHAALYRGFPNSYGTLGYTLSLTIELEPVKPYVHLRHFRFTDPAECMQAVADVAAQGSYQGHRADFIDGTAFSADELYLTVGAFSDVAPWRSDYTRERIYYQSIRGPKEDFLTIGDYLWRWDTDWFWCSRPFGVQGPVIRRMWPRRYRRSDVYRKLVALDRKHGFTGKLDARRGRPATEMVVQDVEIPDRAIGRVPGIFSGRRRHDSRLDVPASPPRRDDLALVPDAAGPGLRELRLLGHCAAAARCGRRALQPPGRGQGNRARRTQGPVFDVLLLQGGVLGAVQRPGIRRPQARLRSARPACGSIRQVRSWSLITRSSYGREVEDGFGRGVRAGCGPGCPSRFRGFRWECGRGCRLADQDHGEVADSRVLPGAGAWRSWPGARLCIRAPRRQSATCTRH